MPIVSDSGPIISFAKTKHFELLRQVTGELAIPAAVYDEVVIKGAGRMGAKATAAADWIKRMEVQDRTLVDQLPRKLHLGEREAWTGINRWMPEKSRIWEVTLISGVIWPGPVRITAHPEVVAGGSPKPVSGAVSRIDAG